MGGAIALEFAALHPHAIAGVIASSPLIEAGPLAELNFFEKMALRVVPKLLPTFALPKLIDGVHLSRDPEVAIDYAADPLIHGYASMLTASEMVQRGDDLLNRIGAKFTLPLLIVHGSEGLHSITQDLLTSVAGSKTFFERAISTDKVYKLFEGSRHERIYLL